MNIQVDSVDQDLQVMGAYKTHPQSTTYYVYIKGSNKYLHRAIMTRVLGRELERHEKVDHKDGNGLNNKRDNLRLVTHSQNLANRGKPRSSKNRFKGISKFKNKWQAKIMVNYKTIHLGTYVSDEDAAKAYDKAATKYFGDNAYLNFEAQ